MATQIFVNLPVKSLPDSMQFFTRLGFSFNPQFTDENAACMVISDTIYAMLLTEARFRDFTPKTVVDAHKSTEVLIALSVENRERVDAMIDLALGAGGTLAREAKDHGFMYERSFNDPDGHIWEIFWIDESAVNQPHEG